MVERNLAKVEVESSRLFSRSKSYEKGKPRLPFFVKMSVLAKINLAFSGAIAKRLCPGLQIRSARFDSGSRLQKIRALPQRKAFVFGPLLIALQAMVCVAC